jgi:hypothetical protein
LEVVWSAEAGAEGEIDGKSVFDAFVELVNTLFRDRGTEKILYHFVGHATDKIVIMCLGYLVIVVEDLASSKRCPTKRVS